jgi:predicted nucleic acid-binding protein
MNDNDRVFIDTNVLIYAHDARAGERHEIAAGLIRELWHSRTGTLSTQVLQEFYINVTRKIPQPLPRTTARRIIGTYQTWPVETIEPALILHASEMEEQYQISFWDALIVAAAQAAGASRILTEDLNPGQRIGGVLIENPFA